MRMKNSLLATRANLNFASHQLEEETADRHQHSAQLGPYQDNPDSQEVYHGEFLNAAGEQSQSPEHLMKASLRRQQNNLYNSVHLPSLRAPLSSQQPEAS